MDYPRYDLSSPVTPLSAAELEGLDRLLQNLPADGAMTLDGMDGYLTALLAGPPEVLAAWGTAEWLPAIWGGDGAAGHEEAAPFSSKRQRKATVVLVLRHLRHLSEQLDKQPDHAPDTWEPIFSVAEQGAKEWVDARDWCTGFLQAVDLLPSAWQALWDDPVLGPALAPLLLLGGGLEPGDEDAADDLHDPQVFDPLSRRVPDAVPLLRAHFRR